MPVVLFRRTVLAAALAAATLLPAAPALAQAWPSKPITVVLGFAPGSGVDVVMRLVQEPLERELGATFVLDYKQGAAGNVASEFVARSRPDGYTLALATAATHGVNAALYPRLPFDVEADFTPIVPMVDVSNVLTINPQVIDVSSIADFIAKVKANPGKYNYASTGNGTGTHLAFAQFNQMAGLDMTHVPYRGGPAAIQAVVTGEVCCIFNQVQTVLGQVRAGRVRLLGVSTLTRVPAVPDVPTIDEAGLKTFESYIWFGLLGPKGLDPAIAERINAAMKKVLEDPTIRQRLAELGNTPRWESVEQFRRTIHADRLRWAEVVKASGATVD
jgi:tripartite-type tricarboxylate transporter receptor subunit TctC